MNLKKLQSTARRRLDLRGEVEFVKLPGSAGRVLASSVATPSLELKHTIKYSEASSLDPADVFHEFSRAKLYELGFRSVENAALVALRDCSKDDPKYIFDANSAVVLVSEVYTSYLLYTYFPEESDQRRNEIVQRFTSTDALTSLHTRMGFWGIGGIAYYKLASEWAGKNFPSKQVEAAIGRASDGKAISEKLSQIELVLKKLPRMGEKDFGDSEQIQILSIIIELFSAKTGLNCE